MESFTAAVRYVGLGIEVLGVGVIVLAVLYAIGRALMGLARREGDVYECFRRQLGHGILLGLELLVAGDIIRTVAVEPTLENVAVLAVIVVIRTFLSFILEMETTGRWPWQQRGHDTR